MKKKFTFLLAAACMLLSISLPGKMWGQTALTTNDLVWGTPIVNENFNNVSTSTSSTTNKNLQDVSFGAFNQVYNNNSNNSFGITQLSQGNNALQLTAGSASPVIAYITTSSITSTFGTTGAFSVKVLKTDKNYFGIYKETNNSAISHASCSVFIKNDGTGKLYINDGTGSGTKWISINSTAYTDNVLEVCIIYNNTNSSTTYGDNITLSSKKAHVFVNGSCVMNGNNPKEFTIPGQTLGVFRVLPIDASNNVCTIDDLKIYNTLPTAASSTYTVSFDCDGATANCPNNIENLEEGDDFTIPSTAPTKNCYTFGGWFDDESNEYELGETYQCPASDLALTADWTLNKYSITYKPNGATGSDVVVSNLNCGSSYTIEGKPNAWEVPAATPNFVKWSTAANGQGTEYNVGQEITISGDLELYAQWSANASYTVTYACNGGTSGCPDNVIVEDGTQITLPAAPTLDGNTFAGWMCDADLETYQPGNNYTVTSNVEFEAEWLENLTAPTFTVTGVSNGTANTYYATANVTIQAADDATIYYTTDGTNPTTSSSVYSSAITVNTEGTKTIKAFATKADNGPSAIASQTVIIVNRADATFTNGVYTTLNSEDAYNTWYTYNKTGNQKWGWDSNNYAKMSGYVSSTSYANEDWLVSPKMHAENGKLVVSFDCVGRYDDDDNVNDMISAWCSSNYPGYGDPTSYTWTEVTTNPALPFMATSWDFISVACNLTGTDVYFALRYKSTNSEAGTFEVKNFTAKQCYPVTYAANGGTGSMTDSNSPYAVGAEVTVLTNGFTAPEDKAFSCWNNGTNNIYPGNKFNMGTAAVTLTAQWVDICHTPATMAATAGASEYVNNNGIKSFKINLSSSVTALSDCVSGGAITSYGFVYSTENTTPTVGGDNCTVIEKGNSYTTANVEFTGEIANATLGATYYICSYATNTAGEGYSDNVCEVEVPANFDDYRYEISYTTNNTAETSTYVYQGDAISGLATPTAANIPAGFTFMGWREGDYSLSNVDPNDYVKNGDAINSDKELKAVFAIQTATTGTLTTSEITTNFTNAAIAYDNDPKSYTDSGDGITWTVKGYATKSAPWIQLRKNNTVAYLKIAASNNISNIRFTISNSTTGTGQSTSEISNHGAFSGYIVLLSSATANATEQTTGNLGYTNSVSNNIANVSPTSSVSEVYVQVTAAARIWDVEVTCGSYSSYCTSVSMPSPAILPIDGNGNITEDAATIPAGAAYTFTTIVKVPSGKKLTIEDGAVFVNANPDNLIIEDGGQLILTDANTNVQATVQKEVQAASQAKDAVAPFGWYTISSSVNNAQIAGEGANTNLITQTIAPYNFDLYRYNEAAEEYQWESYHHNDGFTHMTNGRGYLYRNGEDLTVEFTGTVNTGEIIYHVTNTDASGDLAGFNLIGNPYTHDIYKGAGTAINSNKLSEGFYVATNSGSWTACADNDTKIEKNQGILVQATESFDLTITNTDAKTASAPGKANHDNIKFMVANSQYEDVAYAIFDKGYGLNKINHRNADIQKLYINHDGENYAVAMMSDDTKAFNLNFQAMTFGKYTLSAKANGNFSYLHLIDRLTGEDIDMLLDNEYSFIASPSDNDNRFIVKLSYAGNESSENEIFAYQSGNDIIVNGEGELQVFDVMGRMVMTQRINGVETVNVPTNGMYIFRLNEKIQKIVVE